MEDETFVMGSDFKGPLLFALVENSDDTPCDTCIDKSPTLECINCGRAWCTKCHSGALSQEKLREIVRNIGGLKMKVGKQELKEMRICRTCLPNIGKGRRFQQPHTMQFMPMIQVCDKNTAPSTLKEREFFPREF